MKVIKVIVDKPPKGCQKCRFGSLVDCMIVNRQLDCNSYNKRPDWCPLITKDKYSLALKACLDLVNDMEKIDFDSLRATWERAFFAIGYIDRDSDPQ
jgi:hypothetical protein